MLKGLAGIFVLVLLLRYLHKLRRFNWKGLGLFQVGEMLSNINRPYLFLSVAMALAACGLAAVLFCCLGKDKLRELKHRQALADMIVANKWYESETEQSGGFFKDSPGAKKGEKITYFPKMYYRFADSRIYLKVQATMGREQAALLELDKKVQTGLFCEFISFTAQEPYYLYEFYYNLANTRLNIQDVQVKDGGIELMQGFSWRFDKLPHALIVGGTGSGKSYFILLLIKALVETAKVSVLDPKNADLADLAAVMPNVYHKPDDISECIERFCADMLKRSEEMKTMPEYQTGGNYAAVGLEPNFLIFDEYVAFMELIGTRESGNVMSKLKQIALLGRQMGFFLILACQRPDAKYLADGMRDQFHFRVALGKNSELGYKMIFGESNKKFLDMPAGRGYADMGTNIISEFYVPYISPGYDFLGEIGRRVKMEKEVEPVVEENENFVDEEMTQEREGIS